MPYARKIVLYCSRGYRQELDALVEEFLADGVIFVGVVGGDCSRVENIIDELVVGDGSEQKLHRRLDPPDWLLPHPAGRLKRR